MLIHRLSSTRLVSYNSRECELPLFTGSSLDRRYALQEKQANQVVNVDGYDIDEINERYGHLPSTLQLPCMEDKKPVVKRVKDGNTLSPRSKDKIRNKIESIFRASKGFTFVTLSFINAVEDKKAVQILNKFLTVCRKKTDFQYMWIAERQTENKLHPGNIHFHCIVNTFLEVEKYNSLWVLQQYNAGIEYAGMSYAEMMKNHINNTMQKRLNPFDIKHIKTVEGLGFYLTKYVTKNDSSFKCAAWYCSRGIGVVFTKVLVSEKLANISDDKQTNWTVNKKTGEVYEVKTWVSDYATVRTIWNKKYFKKYFKMMDFINQKILTNFRTYKETLIHFKPILIHYLDYDFEFNESQKRHTRINADLKKNLSNFRKIKVLAN